jgi:hypothetical protein
MPSDFKADFPEPEVQRQEKITGDAGFCRDREVVVLPGVGEPAPEANSDLLAYAVGTSLQVTEERHVYILEDEVPVIRLEERPSEWEVDSDGGYEAEGEGEARGLSSPAQTSEMEQRVEAFLRVVTPDIPTLFPWPACDLSCRRGVSAEDAAQYLKEYGAEYLKVQRLKRSTGLIGSKPRYGGERGMKRLGASWRREPGRIRSGRRIWRAE